MALVIGKAGPYEYGQVTIDYSDGVTDPVAPGVGQWLGKTPLPAARLNLAAAAAGGKRGLGLGGEFGIGDSGLGSGAGLDRDIGAERLHLLDRVRRRCDPTFSRIRLTRYGNAHSPVSR